MEKKKYNPLDEYKVDVEDSRIQKTISKAVYLSETFIANHRNKVDLEHTDSILAVYGEAEKEGIFEEAKAVRELIFGKDIHFYGVCYLWDYCVNSCLYCPDSVENRRVVGLKNQELTVEQAIKDTKAVMKNGHTHICFLTGEDPIGHPAETFVKYLREIDNLELDEIILNIGALTSESFEILRNSVSITSLQYRVFQETYNRKTYIREHPYGPKSNYAFRVESQERALEAGFDNIGLGFLFGLHRFPFDEIVGLKEHAESIKIKYSKLPARICLPSVSLPQDLFNRVPFSLKRGKYDEDGNLIERNSYEFLNELIYALVRLAMPLISIVSSERDQKGMLEILDDYATCTTLNVHPGVGDNYKFHSGQMDNTLHFEQATSYSRPPKETIEQMKSRGFNPVTNIE